jgi:SAM-dependent methyltransferase
MIRHINNAFKMVLFAFEYLMAKRMMSGHKPRFSMLWADRYPCLHDKTKTTGFDRHYVYHPAWAARILAKNQPNEHVDISSTLYFCSLVSAFIPVKYFDYRPADLRLENLSTGSADLLSLPFDDRSIPSLSCMHVVEHVGLGRYGDPLDPDGDLKAIAELKRVLAPGGLLLFVVPVGALSKIMFNAHRIYRYDQIIDYFSDLELKEYVLIPDRPVCGGLVRNPPKELADAQVYGCGCFCFKKRNL